MLGKGPGEMTVVGKSCLQGDRTYSFIGLQQQSSRVIQSYLANVLKRRYFQVFLETSFKSADRDTDRGIFATTPENTVALGAQYDFAPLSFGELSARVDLAYNDGYSFGTIEISEPGHIESDSRTLVNARVTLDQIGLVQTGELRLALWGKNLTDEEYRTYGVGEFEALGFTTVVYNEPLSWGLDLIYEY